MKGLGEVAAISVAPNAVYHATGERVRDLPNRLSDAGCDGRVGLRPRFGSTTPILVPQVLHGAGWCIMV